MAPKPVKRKSTDAAGMQKINDAYYTTLGNAVGRVLANKAFTNLRSKDPLTAGKGGSRDPFDKDAFKAAIKDKRSEQYITAGNASWVNEMWNPLHGVPLNMSSVNDIAEHNYRTPEQVGNVTFDIAAESVTWNPGSNKGSMKLAGPMEPLHALWMAADRAITSTPEDTTLHEAWAAVFRKVGFRYIIIADDMGVFHHQENEKEKLITLGDAVTPSGLQKVMCANCLSSKTPSTNE